MSANKEIKKQRKPMNLKIRQTADNGALVENICEKSTGRAKKK